MSLLHRFSKDATENIYGVHEGDRIKITKLDDPYDNTYIGREGVVEHIDSMGQLHGTWGGLAVIPGEDKFVIIERAIDTSTPDDEIGGAPSPSRQRRAADKEIKERRK